MTAPIRTTCPYCGVGCGVLASRRSGKLEIAGDAAHPANSGRLCSKGSALGDTLGPEDRLLYPAIRDRRVDWNEAVSHIASEFTRIIAEHGPEAVALYVSGQLLTEDYYVANKLMKGYIGTANIDTNSRLCMASAVAGHKRAFGADVVPCCYEDFDVADLIVLVGSNTAWCHPVIYQRIVHAKERNPGLKVIVIDPRRTATCDLADLHLPVKAGSDVALFAGLLAFLHRNGCTNTQFVAGHTQNVTETLNAALETAGDLGEVARVCGVDASHLLQFCELFARTERVITAFSMGVNQSSSGTDKVNSIINCHLLTGRIGRAGMGPFSITGQPNAMGGREAGGMANMLAAHMDLENEGHRDIVQRFWGSPRMASRAGLKAVEMFDAIHDGRIKAVWIMATNPLVSLPDADRAREALQRCELVVVSDCVARTDTLDFAHVRLPAAGWGEKDGTVTNTERRISRQRPFLPPPGEARQDWWAIGEVAKRMGFGDGFAFESAYDIFMEHARLSGVQNHGTRAFDIGGLADLTREEYEALAPIQWPVPTRGHSGTARMLSDGRFFHAEGKAHFVPTRPQAPRHAPGEDFPFVLNTGRIRDQWHTMTRTGRAPRLSDHVPEPYVDMHAQDALLAGVREGELVRVSSRWGSAAARLRTSGDMTRGAVFMPIHWSAANSSDARVGAVVNPAVDAVSGEPEFKHTPAQVEPLRVDWHGVLFAREPIADLDVTWWTRMRGEGFVRYELGGRNGASRPTTGMNRQGWARELLGATAAEADYLDYVDVASGVYRGAHVIGNRLAACLCIAPTPHLPSRAWLASLFVKSKLDDTDRRSLLAGRPLNAAADVGPTVCSCFCVGRNTISAAIQRQRLTTAAQVGESLKAGTNCGSCVPEIRQLLATHAIKNS